MKVRIGVGVMMLTLAGVDLATAQVQPPQDRINTALARARQVGIPVALLESKIAEGKAKGVSLDRVAAAVERRQAALEKASIISAATAKQAGKVRVMRRKGLIYEGVTLSLRRFQDEVNEVRAGLECGIRIEGFSEIQVGDVVECYTIEKVAQKL